MKTYIHFWSYLAELFSEWKFFKFVEKPHFLLPMFFPRKSRRLWDNVEKIRTAGQATDYNMAHAYCMLDT